jgi:hypothetical protein
MKDWRTAGLALAVAMSSVLLFHLSLLGVVFLLPLAWVEKKSSRQTADLAAVMATVGMVGWTFLWKSVEQTTWSVWDTLDLSLPVVLLLGWLLVRALEPTGWRYLFRLGVVLAVVTVVGLPTVAGFMAAPDVERVWKQGFDLVWNQISLSSGTEAIASLAADKVAFFGMVKESVSAAFVPTLFLFWALNEQWCRRARWFNQPPVRWEDFRLPQQAVAPFLALWVTVLVQSLLHNLGASGMSGVLWYAVQNVAAVFWIVYAFVGWGVLRILMARVNVAPLMLTLLGASLVVLLLSGGVLTVLVMVALPLLAVLELWVNFRKNEQRG